MFQVISDDSFFVSHRQHSATPIVSAATSSGPQSTTDVSTARQQRSLQDSGIQYPEGVVKKTWAYGYPRDDDIKIEEVLQKQDLELAVLSAFQWNVDWIMSKLDLPRSKVICVVQAKDEVDVGKYL